MKILFVIFITFVTMLAVFLNALGNKENNLSIIERLRDMNTLNADEREALLTEVDAQLESIKSTLIKNLSSEDEDTRINSAYLLGRYRFSQAAYSLSEVITMETEVVPQSRERRWDRFPAVEALIRIGKPSIRFMLQNLEESDDEKVKELSSMVIYYVEGPKLARIVVEDAIAEQSDLNKKAGLQTALGYFEQKQR